MDTTLLVVTVDWCKACSDFKKKYRANMISYFKREGIDTVETKGISREGETPIAPFIRKVSFYPCFILIDTDLLRRSVSMNPNDVLPNITIMCGSVFKDGENYSTSYVGGEAMSLNGYQSFLQRHNDRLKIETVVKGANKLSFQCRAIKPVNRSYG